MSKRGAMRDRFHRPFFIVIGLAGLILIAVGVFLFHRYGGDTVAVDQQIRQDLLVKTISDFQTMGERSSWEKQAAACAYLKHRLEELGVAAEIQTYSHDQKEWQNLVATLPGRGGQAELLAVAHYDSKSWEAQADSPGADDNASGVAVLLEIARILRETPHQSTIRLVFFSNEESGNLGSKSFARHARENGRNIRGVINIDVVGYDTPWALFSREPFSVLSSDVPFRRKVHMIGKMALNAVDALGAGKRSLKLMARTEDSSILPADASDQAALGLGRIRWDIGNPCI